MKLVCKAEVYNRMSVNLQNAGRKKPQNTILAIGYQCKESEHINLLLKSTSNKVGSKYKVVKNSFQRLAFIYFLPTLIMKNYFLGQR